MKTLLQIILLLSIHTLSCSNYSAELSSDFQSLSPCPLDTCQKVSIELGMPGYNYSAPFTCFEWTDWGTGLEVSWTDGGRILFFTFPNHRICKPLFRICVEKVCNCEWQTIEDCPRNNTLTINLDSCLYGQAILFLDVFLIDQ
ncbi:MAG: hypothetical protein AB8H03_04730 [Saprospiraceae bacterium]